MGSWGECICTDGGYPGANGSRADNKGRLAVGCWPAAGGRRVVCQPSLMIYEGRRGDPGRGGTGYRPPAGLTAAADDPEQSSASGGVISI